MTCAAGGNVGPLGRPWAMMSPAHLNGLGLNGYSSVRKEKEKGIIEPVRVCQLCRVFFSRFELYNAVWVLVVVISLLFSSLGEKDPDYNVFSSIDRLVQLSSNPERKTCI